MESVGGKNLDWIFFHNLEWSRLEQQPGPDFFPVIRNGVGWRENLDWIFPVIRNGIRWSNNRDRIPARVRNGEKPKLDFSRAGHAVWWGFSHLSTCWGIILISYQMDPFGRFLLLWVFPDVLKQTCQCKILEIKFWSLYYSWLWDSGSIFLLNLCLWKKSWILSFSSPFSCSALSPLLFFSECGLKKTLENGSTYKQTCNSITLLFRRKPGSAFLAGFSLPTKYCFLYPITKSLNPDWGLKWIFLCFMIKMFQLSESG